MNSGGNAQKPRNLLAGKAATESDFQDFEASVSAKLAKNFRRIATPHMPAVFNN
jgi:hypothetical protein